MKKTTKLLLVALMLFCGAGMANAQFKIGPRIGVAVNKLHFNKELLNTDNRAGFTGGVEAEFMVPGLNIGIDASLMYVRRSADLGIEYAGEDTTYPMPKVNNDYIDIPVYLKWKFGLPLVGSIVKPFLMTGPDFAFLTSKTAINEALHNKKFDVSWNFGLGVEFLSHLQVSASYGLGITKVAESTGFVSGGEKIDGKNRFWTVTAAYLF